MKGLSIQVDEAKELKKHWDHNVITPGTLFMEKVSEVLRNYICRSIAENPLWKDLTVIFSDASIPMEGEHKLLEFIRSQRSKPDYDP